MTDRAAVDDWVRRYRAAWKSNDPDDIRALFTEDAVYFAEPSRPQPYVGHDAIVAGWLLTADQPGDTEFSWEVLAVDGEVAVIRCLSLYVREQPPLTFDNLFVVRLGADGRAREFTDWWIERKAIASGS